MGAKRKKLKAKKEDVKTWRNLVFWRDLLLYFLAFSYVGHFVEMGWTWFCHIVFGAKLNTNILANPLEPYTIYGAGAVLAILVVRPLARKFKDNILAVFLIATLVCAILEYVSSVVLVWRYGYNPYWWYADRPMNLGGHIWIGNCLLFGLLATLFLKVVYPFTEKLLRSERQVIINIFLSLLVVMFVIYYIEQFWGIA